MNIFRVVRFIGGIKIIMYTILFPSDYFNRNKIDVELEQEYEAAIKAGFDVMLFDYSSWFESRKLVLNRDSDCDLILYRGWMMKPKLYCEFEKQLKNVGYHLVVECNAYKRLHEFVYVYPIIRDDTAPMMKFPLHTRMDVKFLQDTFGRFMVKDYVKSVKGSDFPVYFDSTITQSEFDGWMEKFYQYRGNLLTGGICIKKYLNLKKYDGHTNEYRVFYYFNEPMILMKNSNQSDACCKPPVALINKYKMLDSPFFTLDFAQLEGDSWIIIESGDGQVSGITDSSQIELFYKILKEKN